MTSDRSVQGGPRSTTVTDRPDVPGLAMHLYDQDGWSVIEISGELDIQGVPELRRLLLRAGHQLVLDLRGVTFVDCGGLRTIVGPVSGGARRRIVAEENGHVHRLLRLTGWEKSVALYTSVDDGGARPHVSDVLHVPAGTLGRALDQVQREVDVLRGDLLGTGRAGVAEPLRQGGAHGGHRAGRLVRLRGAEVAGGDRRPRPRGRPSAARPGGWRPRVRGSRPRGCASRWRRRRRARAGACGRAPGTRRSARSARRRCRPRRGPPRCGPAGRASSGRAARRASPACWRSSGRGRAPTGCARSAMVRIGAPW